MARNMTKLIRTGFLALCAGFVLAACNPISAAPVSYKDPIVVKTSDGQKLEFDENFIGKLYDSIASDKDSKVVSLILEKVAEQKYGSFHQYINSEKKLELPKDIELRLSEYFYNQMSSGSYNDDLGRFSEEKFYKACKYELYDMATMTEDVKNNKFFVDASITKENAFSKLKGVYYNDAENARGYIEEKVYPDILKNRLVEDYVIENNYSSLGRAYARKVAYVKISYEDSFTYEKALMQSFADKYIKKADAVSETSPEELNFDLLNTVVRGFKDFDVVIEDVHYLVTKFDASSEAETLAKAAYGTETVTVPNDDDYVYEGYRLIQPGQYVKETKLGKIIESYQKGLKAVGDRFAESYYKDELEKFTSDGKSKEYGLMQKLISLAKEDYTTAGWYVKNGGISDLPSELRDRLFNIKVANTLDKTGPEATEGEQDDQYFRNIKGRKLILPTNAKPYTAEEPFNYVYHDTDGKAFYICQVLEAPSTTKLDKDRTTDYSSEKKAEIAKEVAKVLGTKDSYTKDAYTSYLDDYTFEFFDTDLYEYFKSEYPDLPQFEDD